MTETTTVKTKDLSKLLSKQALALYLALAILVMSAFGVSTDLACKVASFTGTTIADCTVVTEEVTKTTTTTTEIKK